MAIRSGTFTNWVQKRLKQALLADILQYANTDPHTFKQELTEVQFDNDLMPLPVVLEALSTDTEHWGPFYIDILNNIFDEAKKAKMPKAVLSNLMEFAYIEKDNNPFIQTIVDKLVKEINSDHLTSKLAAITLLSFFLKNPVIRNRSTLENLMNQLLSDPNWKVRYVAHTSLHFEDLLPEGQKLSIGDKIRKYVYGDPSVD